MLLVVIAPSACTAQRETAVAGSVDSPSSQVGKRFHDALSSGGEGPLMVVAPAGSFPMRSPASEEGRSKDEGPLHHVAIAHDAHDLPLSDRAAPPPIPLREKLGAHLLALSTIYADGGSLAVQTYTKAAGLNLPGQRVSVQVLAASERDVAGLERRIEEVGGSVQSTFENSIFATLPVPELGALASGEAVWRMDMQHAVLAPAEVVDLETEHGGRNAK